MAKAAAVQFSCSECGYATGKWLGRCPECGSWGTLVEERVARAQPPTEARPLLRLVDVETAEAARLSTGVAEFDRVLGGGLVPASLVLVSGDPGIGKSTLLLMALRAMSQEREAVLVSGEESAAQVKLRADRLGGAEAVRILAETNLDQVCATLERERPEVCVIDSVQTLYAPDLGSAPGSVAQVREAAGRLLRLAKEQGIAVILVGHVTKEGAIAGPRVLEHLVDCALHFEGDRYRAHRVLRAVKNRFGSTNELGVFEMTSAGLVGVDDPSEIFGRREEGEPGSALACALEGTRPLVLEIQALVSPTDLAMPRRVGTGVDPKRLSMIVAVLGRHAGVALGQADVFVNVAGGLRIDEPGADLGIALAIASAARGRPVRPGVACFGEVGLTGALRPVSQAERRLAECAKLGLAEALVSNGTRSHGNIRVTAGATLRQAIMVGLDEEALRKDKKLLAALGQIAPGTPLRAGIDDIIRAQHGALIVTGEPNDLAFLFSGGMRLDLPFTAQLLYELAKMDGAIILNGDSSKIVYANVQLMPDPTIASDETGTRHRTAERVAKQTDAMVISISQQRETVTLFIGDLRYQLGEISDLLARTNQALGTLETYRQRLDQGLTRLTALEFQSAVMLDDVLIVLQRAEMTTRMAEEIERNCVELGQESRLIRMQLDELMEDVPREKAAVVFDYELTGDSAQASVVLERLAVLPYQRLLEVEELTELLGYRRDANPLDYGVAPRGFRVLSHIPRVPDAVIRHVVRDFSTLDAVIRASHRELEAVDGVGSVRAREIREGLRRLQEHNLVDRYLQL